MAVKIAFEDIGEDAAQKLDQELRPMGRHVTVRGLVARTLRRDGTLLVMLGDTEVEICDPHDRDDDEITRQLLS